MKHVNATILILITLLTLCISPAVFAQSECPPDGGSQDGGYGKGATLPCPMTTIHWNGSSAVCIRKTLMIC